LGSDALLEYHSNYNANKGEIKRVRDITGNVLTFEDPLFDTYGVADTAFARKVTFVENVCVRDLTIRGTDSANGETGLEFLYCNNVLVDNVNFEYQDIYQCLVDSSIYVRIVNSHFYGTYYDGVTGWNYFAITVLNASQWVNVIGNHGVECRHLFVCSATSSGQNRYGQPMFINVEGNTANHCNDDYAYQNHGFGRFVNIVGNTANGCAAGVAVEGRDVTVCNNQFSDCSEYGIKIGYGANTGRILISGNNIQRSHGVGILLYSNTSYALSDVSVTGNMVSLASTSISNIVTVSSNADYIEISGNTLYGSSSVAGGYGISNASTGCMINGNRIMRKPTAIYSVGGSCIISGNIINQTTAYGIYAGGANSIITGNRIGSTTGTPINLTTAANDCVVMGNNYYGAGSSMVIASTGCVYQTAATDLYNRTNT
jgi:hypothetical protein